jgi:hypothetical protein
MEQVVELLKHFQTSVLKLTKELEGKNIEIEILKNMIKSEHSNSNANIFVNGNKDNIIITENTNVNANSNANNDANATKSE